MKKQVYITPKVETLPSTDAVLLLLSGQGQQNQQTPHLNLYRGNSDTDGISTEDDLL